MSRRRNVSKMKRVISGVFALICVVCMSVVPVMAQTYDVKDTDISITVDSEEWCVFTRESVRGNSELKSLGITEEYFYNSLINTNAYLDMFYLKENSKDTIEFKVVKENTTDINNYKNLTKKELRNIGDKLADKMDALDWEVYYNECSYIYLEYDVNNLHYLEYYTVVNQEIYRLIASKSNNFTTAEQEMIRGIVDNAQYTINPVYANESWGITKFWAEYGIQIIVAVILIIVIVAAVTVYKKRRAIKDFLTGKKNPNEEVKKELKSTRYVETAPKQSATKSKKSATKPKQSADPSMVTINRQKRSARKGR